MQLPEKLFTPSHIYTWNSREETTWIHRQLWQAALRIDLIFVVSRGTVLASLLPGPLKYRDFPSLSTPQPVPTWPPVILYQRGLSFLSNLSNISLWLGTLDTQVPCDASRKKKYMGDALVKLCWTEERSDTVHWQTVLLHPHMRKYRAFLWKCPDYSIVPF